MTKTDFKTRRVWRAVAVTTLVVCAAVQAVGALAGARVPLWSLAAATVLAPLLGALVARLVASAAPTVSTLDAFVPMCTLAVLLPTLAALPLRETAPAQFPGVAPSLALLLVLVIVVGTGGRRAAIRAQVFWSGFAIAIASLLVGGVFLAAGMLVVTLLLVCLAGWATFEDAGADQV